MLNKLITGQEKAIIGGATAGVLTLLALVGISGQMTVKEAVYALVSWLFTHALVWTATNTPKPEVLVVPPTAVAPNPPAEEVTAPEQAV